MHTVHLHAEHMNELIALFCREPFNKYQTVDIGEQQRGYRTFKIKNPYFYPKARDIGTFSLNLRLRIKVKLSYTLLCCPLINPPSTRSLHLLIFKSCTQNAWSPNSCFLTRKKAMSTGINSDYKEMRTKWNSDLISSCTAHKTILWIISNLFPCKLEDHSGQTDWRGLLKPPCTVLNITVCTYMDLASLTLKQKEKDFLKT